TQDRKQKRCHLLSCGLAAEQKHPITRRVDGIERAFQKNLLEIGLLLQKAFKIHSSIAAQLHVHGSFGSIRKFCSVQATEKIPWKQQGDDLLTSIRQSLGKLYNARQYRRTPILRCRHARNHLPGRVPPAIGSPVETRKLLGAEHAAQRVVTHDTF